MMRKGGDSDNEFFKQEKRDAIKQHLRKEISCEDYDIY